jgi:hypothetical protein
MDHIVYVDHKSGELEKLIANEKKMIIRGATGRKLPYGRVHSGDILFFIRNNGEGLVRAKTQVIKVHNSEKMSKEESMKLVEVNAEGLQLSSQQYEKWAGKRYLVLITVDRVVELEPFKIDRSNYRNMDDWLPVEDINTVKLSP